MKKSFIFIGSALVLIFLAFFAQDIFEKKKLVPTPTSEVSSSRKLIRDYLMSQFSPYQKDGLKVSPIAAFEAYSGNVKNEKTFMGVKVINGVIYHKKYGPKPHLKGCPKKVLALLKKVVETYHIPDLELVIFLGDGVFLPDTFPSPVFTFDVRKDVSDRAKHLLFPDPHLIRHLSHAISDRMKKAHSQHPWAQKLETFYFRGASTGGQYTLETISKLSRPKLVILSTMYPDIIDARFTKLVQFGDNESEMKAKKLLEQISPVSPHVHKVDHLKYKYLLCVDGNVGAWGRPLWIMSSNSVLVYQTDYIQWINPAMKPHVHYVPIKKDLTDLFSVFEWMKSHDEEVKNIVHNANELMDDVLKEESVIEDLAFYLNQYASLCRWASDSDAAKPSGDHEGFVKL